MELEVYEHENIKIFYKFYSRIHWEIVNIFQQVDCVYNNLAMIFYSWYKKREELKFL